MLSNIMVFICMFLTLMFIYGFLDYLSMKVVTFMIIKDNAINSLIISICALFVYVLDKTNYPLDANYKSALFSLILMFCMLPSRFKDKMSIVVKHTKKDKEKYYNCLLIGVFILFFMVFNLLTFIGGSFV